MTQTSTAVEAFDGDMDPADRRQAIAMWKQSVQLAKSTLAGDFKGKPDDVYTVVAYADQFGVAPGNALQMIWIIKGRIVPRSEFLAAITRRAGHEIRFEESSSEKCTVAIRRLGEDYWSRVTFTYEDAKRAKLTDKDLWKTYTADMLAHATVRRAVKRICPDVLLGLDVGGDEGIPADRYRPPAAEKVVDVAVDWDDEPADGELVDDAPEGVDAATGEIIDAEEVPPPTAADEKRARDKAMRGLMATCGKAFPEDDAPAGQKAHRQRLLRHAAQHAVFKEHRSAKDLTTAELNQVEAWVHANFVSDAAVTKVTYEILDGDVVRFRLGDHHKDFPPAPADGVESEAA